MARFIYNIIKEISVDITLEDLRKNHPEIVEQMIEQGYEEEMTNEDLFEEEIGNIAMENDDLYQLIYGQYEDSLEGGFGGGFEIDWDSHYVEH
jgi:hypothetical protein